MNISRYNATADNDLNRPELQKYVENGQQKTSAVLSKLESMKSKQAITRNTPETLNKMTNSRNSSEIKPIDRYTGLSTPALKPIGMML